MRLIDADAMLVRLEEWNTSDSTDKALYNFTLHRILEQPTIEPERKGRWLHGKEVDREVFGTIAITHYDGWKCSLCDCLVEQANVPTYKYCPNCGADMREQP